MSPFQPAREGFDPIYYTSLNANEARHFWHRARSRVIAGLVGELVGKRPGGCRILEVGCGTGNLLRVLVDVCRTGSVVGMDLFAEGLRYARRRVTCALVQGDLRAWPFRVRFDLIGLFDVLEHLSDDEQVLHDLYAILAPAGHLILTVPAHPSLWSYFDVGSRHCRRYELADIEAKVMRAGFGIKYSTQYMAGIFPALWLRRRLSRGCERRAVEDSQRIYELTARELTVIPVLNWLLYWLLAPEAGLIKRGVRLPIGTSLLVVARKGDCST